VEVFPLMVEVNPIGIEPKNILPTVY